MDYFTADTHFGHRNINAYAGRPWRTVEEHDAALIRRWNAVVSPDDTVYHLGDFSFLPYRYLAPLLKLLNGSVMLLPGNHDPCWPGHKRWPRWERKYRDAGLVVLNPIERLATSGGLVKACHFPYAGDHTSEERFTEWRPKDDGSILLHGHVHNAWKVRGRQVNVGVDVWDYRPVSVPELRAALANG